MKRHVLLTLWFLWFAGDIRVQTVPSLTSYHEMGRREHNRIANFLRSFYPDTTEGNEELFQVIRYQSSLHDPVTAFGVYVPFNII